MIFNSFEFLIFFGVFLLAYFSIKSKQGKLLLCLVGSYFFYGWWDWRFLSLIAMSTVLDFFVGRKMYESNDDKERKRLLIISMVFNLGMLAVFKYLNFFIDSFQNITDLLGFQFHESTLKIILPVGISFYTFQTMSYTIDIYRKTLKPEENILTFATYVAFFPQLVAGPIVRASTLLPQFHEEHKFVMKNMILGLGIVLMGFFKKVVVADSVAVIVDQGFANPDMFSSLNMAIVVFFYAIQIYCDFSGYSDIAIGVAKMLGYEFPPNFNMPYFSKGFSEFWRRWHISLSSWLRDYLYISLGGNRGGTFFTYRNLMLTMLLGGLWHGASWAFVFWGFLHGLYLILERLFKPINKAMKKALPGVVVAGLSMLTVFMLTCLAWIFFRAPTFGEAFLVIERIASFDNLSFGSVRHKFVVMECFLLVGMLIAGELFSLKYDLPNMLLNRPFFRYVGFAFILWMIFLFGTFSSNQFIYFQF